MSDLSKQLLEELRSIEGRLDERLGQLDARIDETISEVNVRLQKVARGRRQEGAAARETGPSSLLSGAHGSFAEAWLTAAQENGRGRDVESNSKFTSDEAAQVRPGALLAAMASGLNREIVSNLNEYEVRALRTATGADGGFLVDEIIGALFIDTVRPRSRVLEAGARTFAMDAPTVHLPGWEDPLTGQWVAEGEERDETLAKFRRVTLTAKTVTTRVVLTNEVFEDAGAGFGGIVEIVETETARALGSAVDRAALVGPGTGAEPLGIYYTDGVNEVELGAGNGATPADYDFLLDAMFEVEDANFTPDAVLWSARTGNTLRKLKTGLSGDKTQLPMPEEVRALRRLTTNQIPNDLQVGSAACSAAFVGQWDQLIIGFRPSLTVQTLIDPYTKSGTGQIVLNMRLRADVALLNRAAFTRVKGIDD